jgi:drug/metabolite transporter (DMT)-like permease
MGFIQSMPDHILGIFLSLSAALTWGSGDFSGGVATRQLRPYQVLFLSSASSLLLLLSLAIGRGESLPSIRDLLVALPAGLMGAAGLAALYRGLTLGNAAVVSPVAGVIGAMLPMLVGIFSQGFPRGSQLLGFSLGLAGIWLVARKKGPSSLEDTHPLRLAILAGIGFGGFLALIPQIESTEIYMPLVFSKLSSLGLAALVLWRTRPSIHLASGAAISLLSGFFDAGGNILYLLAVQYTRLDIVAILASLYPAWTVLLSRLVYGERISRTQWFGVWVCLGAIMLITT